MSEEATGKIPSVCPSPTRVEKTDSSSSRQSGSPVHWDFEQWSNSARVRPSSWDDSDDDLSPTTITSSKPSRIYSSESQPLKSSISSEINELKMQFFQSLEKENLSSNDSSRLESLKEKLEMKLRYDRRHSPARVRRRSRSSSSSSPVPEVQKSPETKETAIGPDDDSDSTSPRTLDMDPKYYLNNFFSELRSRRISMLDSVSLSTGKDCALICDNMKLEILNELNAPDLNDDGGYFCKTSRKLSQILEVEENRKDMDKSSEGSIHHFEKPERGDSSSSLQTARSRKSEKELKSRVDSRQRKRDGYKSLSFEEFGNFEKVGKTSRGSLSERSARIFGPKLDGDFINLCAKSGKTHLSSPKLNKDQEEVEKFLCFAGVLGAGQHFPTEPTPRKEEDTEHTFKSRDDVAAALGSPTSGKGTDSSEPSRTSRTKSGRSKRSSEPKSPKFALSIGGDSARSLRLDDVSTPHSKSEENKTVSERSPEESSFRSGNACEWKTEKYISLESPSLESLKSSRDRNSRGDSRNSAQRSQKTGKGSSRGSIMEHTSTRQNLAFENRGNSPSESSRSFKSKESSKKTSESEDGCSSRSITRTHKIPKLGLPIDDTGRPQSQNWSSRGLKAAEVDADPTQNNTDRSSACRSRSGRFRKSTPRSRTPTPKSIGSCSLRSEEEEKPAITFSQEFESTYDTLSISAATRKSRETETPSQQPSTRSECSAVRKTFTPVNKSPVRSGGSWGKASAGSVGNISPSKSEQSKSRPTSWTSAESRFSDVPPQIEKLDLEVRSGRTSNRSSNSEESEEKEERRSSPRSKSGPESDRLSNKRLSIINEVTFEDLESSCLSIDNEEKQSKPPSRRSRRGVSPKSFEGKSPKESTPRGGMWTELIQTFEGSQQSSLFSEKNFPGCPFRKEGSSARLSVYPSATETSEKISDSNEDSFELSSKVRSPRNERNRTLERSSDQQREEDFTFSLVSKDSFSDKMKVEEDRTSPIPKNLYFVDVDKSGRFGIGEFGDITWWSGGKSVLEDFDKPKDHGDGIHSFRSSEVLLLRPEKREKEMKNQRQLWTELKKDFRDSRMFSTEHFRQSDSNSVCLKTSKSDNCLDRKLKEESECHSSLPCQFLGENEKQKDVQKELFEKKGERNANPQNGFGSGSTNSAKESPEMTEFECEKTPRLSRSMSDLVLEIPPERYGSNEFRESRDFSRGKLFERSDSGNEKNESINLDIFLARKKEEETKSNNWLHLKGLEGKKSEKREKKARSKTKKGLSLSRETNIEYLISSKSQRTISGLKRRNSNCFQNFYKRFISVFCVTSNSSAATST